jgi:hypothetical protein
LEPFLDGCLIFWGITVFIAWLKIMFIMTTSSNPKVFQMNYNIDLKEEKEIVSVIII